MLFFSTAVTIIIILAVLALAVFLFFKWRFKLASSNEALIITGTRLGDPEKDNRIYKDNEGRYMKVVRGGGHRLKMFQNSTKVDLKSFQLEIETPKVYTSQGVGVYGKAVASIKVADTLQGIVRYAEQFLGKKDSEIHDEVSNVLSSNLRAILSKLSVEQINQDRESFNSQVTGIAQDQLDRMGFVITSFGLADIWDDDNYLENLGRPQTASVKKTADIAEAENKRETEIKQAEVNEAVSKEQYQREMNVADSRKEKDIKESRIAAETQQEKAKADASYDMEMEDRQLEVKKRKLDIREQDKEMELRLARRERENEVEMESKQVEVRKQQAEADYLSEVRQAQANAEARKQEGQAEAQVIRDKSEAEVEALRNRSEAMNKYREVVLMEKMMNMMPEFARAVSESMANVESIRIMDSGNGGQLESLPKSVTNMVAGLQESLGQMTGFDLEGMLNNISGKTQNQSSTLAEANITPADQHEENTTSQENEKPGQYRDADESDNPETKPHDEENSEPEISDEQSIWSTIEENFPDASDETKEEIKERLRGVTPSDAKNMIDRFRNEKK
ncbi:flotillin family protein [Virgibacillus sp. NKC19-3]|uniref:flotillin family protein n=1 Tax=Virgibacillus saliphilus TaxID=2831674 RepID=UPI001C9B9A0A|nr:SPFH domain-containing protein [Virgibacillus sp. NKC19-3]MBY7142433.1 flotillin family protein [Virgibacillus sp. NKC19-3]